LGAADPDSLLGRGARVSGRRRFRPRSVGLPGSTAEKARAREVEKRSVSPYSGRVRVPAFVVLLGAVAAAGPRADGDGPEPDPDEVRRLAGLLGHDSPSVRGHAHRRLAAMGDAAARMLQELTVHDTEAQRRVRALTRSLRRMRLRLVEAPETIAFGDPLTLVVELRNDSDWAYRAPLAVDERQRGRRYSALRLLDGARATRLEPEQVETANGAKNAGLVPGGVARLTIRLAPADIPFREPGAHRLVVAYNAKAGRRLGGQQDEIVPLALETGAFTVRCRARTPAQLEAALQGDDRKARASALFELAQRDDAALLPLLRRYVGRVPDAGFRRRAIRRLGEKGAEQDLPIFLDAVRDPDRNVAKAAVEALGSYRGNRRARARLLVLTHDRTLRLDAVKALRRHPHGAVVRRFIGLLKRESGLVAKEAADILAKWTGLPVTTREREVEAFERWWNRLRNRREFAERHRR